MLTKTRFRLVMVQMLGMLWISGGMARAADWPNYRGPDHNGFSQETDWQTNWDAQEPKILWTKSIGFGFGSIAVADGRAFLMGNTGKEGDNANTDIVYCVDAESGKEIWRHEYPCLLQPKLHEGGPLATPTVDGKVVYTLSRMGDLFCFNAASGEIIWQKQLADELGCKLPGWQIAGSPLVAGDLLVLNVGTAGLALNKKNGEVVWENGMDTCGYATPVPYTMDSQVCFAIFGKQSVMGVAAKDGEKLWEFEWKTKYDINAADPIVIGNRVFISSGYNRGCAMIKVVGRQVNEVWQSRVMRTQMNCAVLWGEGGDHVYGFDEGELKCIDLNDGTEKWGERSLGKGSLIMSFDGRMIIMSDKGELVTAKADPSGFTALARTQLLPRSKCWTTPALANGKIYARNAVGDAACVDVSKK